MHLRRPGMAALALAGCLLGVYWLTMPPDITFEDTALFAGACRTLGLPHPPGYPLHTLTCAPFVQAANLIAATPAQAVALSSAVTAALACAVTLLLLLRLTGSLAAAGLAAGLLGLAPGFWAQAIIPEVYGLNALLLAITLYAAHSYVLGGQTRWLLGLALVTGLGLANHWPLYVIAYPAVLLWLAPAWKKILAERTKLLGATLCGVLGLAPYVHLLTVSPDAFLFDTKYQATDFWAYVSREIYGLGGEVLDGQIRLATAVKTGLWFVGQYHYVFGALIVGGLVLMLQRRRRAQSAAVLWGMLSCTTLLALVRPFDPYSPIATAVFSAYPLPAYFFATIPLAYALQWVLQKLALRPAIALSLSCAALFAVARLALPAADRSWDNIAVTEAQLVLRQLPAGALLLNRTNDFTFPITYARFFSDQRGDVTVINELDYFATLHDDGRLSAEEEARLGAEDRPVAFINNLQLATHGRSYHGIYFTIAPEVAAGRVSVELTPQVREYLRSMYDAYQTGVHHAFTRQIVDHTIIMFVLIVTEQQLAGNANIDPADLQLLELFKRTAVGQYGYFVALLTSKDINLSLNDIEDAARGIEPYMPELGPARRADIMHFVATARVVSGQLDSAQDLLRSALAQFPSADNFRVLVDLLQLYAVQEDFAAYERLRRRFPGLEASVALQETDRQCALMRGNPCVEPIESSK